MSDDAETTSPLLVAGVARPVPRRRPDWLVVGAVVAAVGVLLALGALLWTRSPVATANSTQPSGPPAAVPTLLAPPPPSRIATSSPASAPPAERLPTRVLVPPAVNPAPQVPVAPRPAPPGPAGPKSPTGSGSTNGASTNGGNGGNNGNGGHNNGDGGDLFPEGF